MLRLSCQHRCLLHSSKRTSYPLVPEKMELFRLALVLYSVFIFGAKEQ
jgi:hypothetical protein